MIRLEILRQKPHLFRSLTGITIEQFEVLFAKLLPIWEQQERKRLTRPNRQRAIGAGRKYRLSIPDMLLMTLIWLRQYWNTEALGFFFGLDKSTVSRNTRRMLKALQKIGIQS
ncbi:MAG: transposase family protein [Armatimonadota bacterium]